MDEALLEIRDYDGDGYKPLIYFGGWRAAMLRYLDNLDPERIDSMERHTETDEVFVLLKGRGVLVMGGNQAQVGEIYSQAMENGKLYNVKRYAWHTILQRRYASIRGMRNCSAPSIKLTSIPLPIKRLRRNCLICRSARIAGILRVVFNA